MEPGHDLADSVTIEAHRLEGEGLHGSVRYAPAGASHDYEPAVRSILKKPAANRASGARSVVLTAGDDSTLSSLAVDSDQGTRPVDGSGLKRRVKTLNIFRAFPKDRKGVPGRTSTSDAHQPAEAATPASASYLSCILSGLICGLLFFVFCAVFSSMIFGKDSLLLSAVPLGIGVHTLSTLIGNVAFARFSGCKAVMAGPDINPTVFMAEAVGIIMRSDSIDESNAIPTVLVSMVIASLLIGVAFASLGLFRLTGIVGFVPANVVGGFLSCIGWKVFKSSIEVACPISDSKAFKSYYLEHYFGSWQDSWMFFLPALAIGLPLYFFKRWRIGKPTINFPLFTIGPVAFFYVIAYATGYDIDEVRDHGWLYPEASQNDFWSGWEELYGGLFSGDVAWDALPGCIPIWIVMVLIISLDNMLKLASTEAVLHIDFDYNHEMKVGGFTTLVTAILAGNSVYGQTKFNVINFSITHSVHQSLPTYVTGGFCGVLFFSGLPLINFLPRFLLSGLLVFAATGFLVENLWDARKTFNRLEFSVIWLIFSVNLVFSELLPQFGLLIAIIVGLVWAAIAFAIHFARKSNQLIRADASISGANHCSTAVRSATQEMKLGIIGVWFHIFKLGDTSGYIFFGTASRLYELFKEHLAESQTRPIAQRTKFVIIDMGEVYGLDATACSVFNKIQRLALKVRLELVWAGLEPNVAKRLRSSGIKLREEMMHTSFDAAEKAVEDLLLSHVHKLAQHWLIDKSARHIYNKAMLHDALTSTHDVFDGRSLTHSVCPSQLLRWATKVMVKQGDYVYRSGEVNNGLYLLYRGQVRVEELDKEPSTIYTGAFFNEHVVYAHPESLSPSTAIATQDSVMLRMSKEERDEMHWQDPHAAFELVVAVFKQVEMRSPLRRHLHRANYLHEESAKHDRDERTRLVLTGVALEPISEPAKTDQSLHGMHRAKRNARMSSLVAKDVSLRKVLNHALHNNVFHHSERSTHHRSRSRDGSAYSGLATPTLLSPTSGTKAEGASPASRKSSKPGDDEEPRAQPSHSQSTHYSHASHLAPLHDTTIDAEFIHGNDFKVPLPDSMAAHYRHIFELNDHSGVGHLKIDELSKFMSLTAHGLSVAELEEMMHEVGIDEDQDEAISETDFLEFIRRTLLADLPASKIARINAIYHDLADLDDEKSPMTRMQTNRDMRRRPSKTLGQGSMPMVIRHPSTEQRTGITRRQLEKLFTKLGFHSEATDLTEVFDEVDVDGDGCINYEETLAAISILKRNVLEVHELEASFTRFRAEARNMLSPAEAEEQEEDHLVRVSDLVNALGVSEREAEEMMFIADMNEDQTVGFTEFKQVVVNWS